MCLNRRTMSISVLVPVMDCIGAGKPASIISLDVMFEFVLVMILTRVSVEDHCDSFG
jgi:hypothetical protein